MCPIEVKKQERETTQSLLRRFTKGVRESGILLQVRAKRFRERPKSNLAKKMSALRREQIKKQRLLEEKSGKPR